MLDLRRLRYFVAVAENGNISKAAQKIFLTQPALSRQIKALEDEVGLLLLERQAHSVRLTPAGEALLAEARTLLQQAEEALARVRACAQGVRLRIGYAPSLVSGWFSGAVESFVQKHPGVGIELFDLSSREMLSGLEAGSLDLALTIAPQRETRGLHWTPLAALSWQLALHHRHPLAALRKVSAQQVAGESLLVFCQRDYPEYWSAITAWLREQGQPPVVAGEYDGISSLFAAVESRLGVALVGAHAADLLPSRLRLKPLSKPPKPLKVAAGHQEGRASEKPLAVLVEELRHAAKNHLFS